MQAAQGSESPTCQAMHQHALLFISFVVSIIVALSLLPHHETSGTGTAGQSHNYQGKSKLAEHIVQYEL